MAYGDTRSRVFYIIPFADLKERVDSARLGRLAHCGRDSIGLLVALADIKDLVQEL